MNEENPLRKLRDIVAALYPEEATARRVATDAGLDERQITLATYTRLWVTC